MKRSELPVVLCQVIRCPKGFTWNVGERVSIPQDQAKALKDYVKVLTTPFTPKEAAGETGDKPLKDFLASSKVLLGSDEKVIAAKTKASAVRQEGTGDKH